MRAAALAGVLATIALAAAPPAPSDLVELDVVALDRHDGPVDDLAQTDFEIKEDGTRVEIKTFSHVASRGSIAADDQRSVVLLMDDVGVPISGKSAMQQIAHVLLSPMGSGDEIAVVRLSRSGDEAFGDVQSARDRIDSYRGGVIPFSSRDTPEHVLNAVARIAAQLEPIEHRRKAIVCVGLPVVCDIGEPAAGASSVLWKSWVAAMASSARANAAVYSVDPTGLTQRSGSRGVGVVRLTGGELFGNSNDFVSAADRVWREASDYYLLGYWPAPSKRDLHSIDVKALRPGVRVRARRFR